MRRLGLDFGEKYLGVALSEENIALPLAPISTTNWNVVFSELAKLTTQNAVEEIILGLPLSLDGGGNESSKKVQEFAKILKKRLNLPVLLVDESYSSKEALSRSFDLGVSERRRRHLDSLAAVVILERFLLNSGSNETH